MFKPSHALGLKEWLVVSLEKWKHVHPPRWSFLVILLDDRSETVSVTWPKVSFSGEYNHNFFWLVYREKQPCKKPQQVD